VFLLLFGKECAIDDVLGMLDRVGLLQRQTFVETCDRCRGFGRCLALVEGGCVVSSLQQRGQGSMSE
jgi:hypothetical protein